MNSCQLIGRLVADPELRVTQSTGKSVCSFKLAVDRRFKNKAGEKEADFLPVIVWGPQADACAKYLRKGSQVAVSGSIQTRSYEAADKTRRYVTEIIAEEVQFLSRNEGTSGSQTQQREPEPGEDAEDELPEDLTF